MSVPSFSNKKKQKENTLMTKDPICPDFNTSLEEVLRDGARQMLQSAIENEVAEFLEKYSSRKDVKRNGYLPQRLIQTGIGPLPIRKPRVRGERFTSALLPKYMRRVPSIEALIPALYLRGISTNSMEEALTAILGENAKGLSPTNIVRLKEEWTKEYDKWCKRSLTGKEYVYLWADGIYCNVRLSDERPCLLVLIGSTAEGKKELLAVHDGIRESKLSWKTVLSDLKKRGLSKAPQLGIGDGALGFWAALEEEFPSCRTQRCWVHKTANLLDKMPKKIQPDAKSLIHEMYMAPDKKSALDSFDRFMGLYESKYPKACECLVKDKERLFTFYDFPAKHWQHIRTTNPIESTIRHRAEQTKGCGSRKATLSLFYKLGITAEKHWRKLRGSELLSKVIEGVIFKDGEEVKKAA